MKNGRAAEANATAGGDAGIVAWTPDLFDDAPVPLGDWPSAAALEGRFLARLLRGGELSAGDWLRHACSMRLAAEVGELRALGWAVQSRRETVRTADRGRPAVIARYCLEQHQRKAAIASERGERFIAAVDAAEGRRAAQ